MKHKLITSIVVLALIASGNICGVSAFAGAYADRHGCPGMLRPMAAKERVEQTLKKSRQGRYLTKPTTLALLSVLGGLASICFYGEFRQSTPRAAEVKEYYGDNYDREIKQRYGVYVYAPKERKKTIEDVLSMLPRSMLERIKTIADAAVISGVRPALNRVAAENAERAIKDLKKKKGSELTPAELKIIYEDHRLGGCSFDGRGVIFIDSSRVNSSGLIWYLIHEISHEWIRGIPDIEDEWVNGFGGATNILDFPSTYAQRKFLETLAGIDPNGFSEDPVEINTHWIFNSKGLIGQGEGSSDVLRKKILCIARLHVSDGGLRIYGLEGTYADVKINIPPEKLTWEELREIVDGATLPSGNPAKPVPDAKPDLSLENI